MKSPPFYIIKDGPNIIQPGHIREFSQANPSLQPYLSKHRPELRLLRLSAFESLCHWVISQQISGSVATKLIARVKEQFEPLSPANLHAIKPDELRALGLSGSKTATLIRLAAFFIEDGIADTARLNLSTIDAINMLTQIKGIGEWTVQMHLIFNEGAMDILAVKDLVVRKGIQKLYNLPEIPNEKEARIICKDWGELATVGTILSWEVIGR